MLSLRPCVRHITIYFMKNFTIKVLDNTLIKSDSENDIFFVKRPPIIIFPGTFRDFVFSFKNHPISHEILVSIMRFFK